MNLDQHPSPEGFRPGPPDAAIRVALAIRLARLAFAAVIAAALVLICSCSSEEGSRRDKNLEDLESAITLKHKQDAIEDFITSMPQVRSARVFVGPESVIIEIIPHRKAVLDSAVQERINSYVSAQTGFEQEKIVLWVPEDAVPGFEGRGE